MFEKILYPIDFSDVSLKALAVVKQLKEAGAKDVVILHVIDSRFFDAMAWYSHKKNLKEIGSDLEQEAKRQISTIEKDLLDYGFNVNIRIVNGVPSSAILRVEKEENVSAIVIGSHGMSNLEEMLIGSVSEKVIRKARGLVLVVKR
ncbi:MAG: universal stress protein [Deltaproteobacteria bacterium]|nr:universal stress protein [Deltaproteobacteria bacterium]MBN2687602.1 universal stress protein [Deltaproteobacteria bacterium]